MRSTRREFLRWAIAAPGLRALAGSAAAAQPPLAGAGLIDVNVNLGHWPARRVRGDEPAALVALLEGHGVKQAWVASFDALLHKDLAAVNTRLAAACRQHGHGRLLPFGSVNPKAPDWEEDLRRCAQEHRMPGVRLHPNYHGYRLDDPEFARLLRLATDHGLIVQLALVMEDERMMSPLLRVEPVDPAPLAGLVRQTRGLRLVLVNALRTLRGPPLADLLAAGEVYVEIAMLEGIGGVANFLAQAPLERLLFGSHAPLFYFAAALLKLRESPLTDSQRQAISRRNAERLLPRPP